MVGWIVLISVIVTVTGVLYTFQDQIFVPKEEVVKQPEIVETLMDEEIFVSTNRMSFILDFSDVVGRYDIRETRSLDQFICYVHENPSQVYYFEKSGATCIDHVNKVVYQFWTEEQAEMYDDLVEKVGS